jgi:SHS2 domain-containing protein
VGRPGRVPGPAATVEPLEEERIEITGEDAEELLVTWLQEILYRHEMKRRLFSELRVESAAPPRPAASARGERFDPGRHEILAHIKAATYHDLAIVTEATPAGPLLRVRVVLDT